MKMAYVHCIHNVKSRSFLKILIPVLLVKSTIQLWETRNELHFCSSHNNKTFSVELIMSSCMCKSLPKHFFFYGETFSKFEALVVFFLLSYININLDSQENIINIRHKKHTLNQNNLNS